MTIVDRVFAFCVILFGGLYIYSTTRIQALAIGDPVGPRTIPYLIGIGFVLSGLLLLADSLKKTVAEETGSTAAAPPSEESTISNVPAVAAVVGWIALYIFLFDKLGFVLSCALFMFGYTLYFNRGRWITNILVSIMFPIAFYWALTTLLYATLPAGVIGEFLTLRR